jgi:hypothetical protein
MKTLALFMQRISFQSFVYELRIPDAEPNEDKLRANPHAHTILQFIR